MIYELGSSSNMYKIRYRYLEERNDEFQYFGDPTRHHIIPTEWYPRSRMPLQDLEGYSPTELTREEAELIFML